MAPNEIWQQRALVERGMVLAVLYNAPLAAVDLATIRGCLDMVGLPTQMTMLKRHLVHLEQRGYLTQHTGHAMGVSLTTYALTPDGRDLVVGANTDPGVNVPAFEG